MASFFSEHLDFRSPRLRIRPAAAWSFAFIFFAGGLIFAQGASTEKLRVALVSGAPTYGSDRILEKAFPAQWDPKLGIHVT